MQNKNIFSHIFFKYFLVFIFIFLCFFFIKNNFSKNLDTDKIQNIKIAGKILKVELALTEKEQEQGLSGRKELKEDEGMLFVFNHIGQYSFWMKDMNFPIDIIWIGPASTQGGEDLNVVYIKKNALPESYPDTFLPDQNAKYILEVNASFSEKNNLKVGDKVEFCSLKACH